MPFGPAVSLVARTASSPIFGRETTKPGGAEEVISKTLIAPAMLDALSTVTTGAIAPTNSLSPSELVRSVPLYRNAHPESTVPSGLRDSVLVGLPPTLMMSGPKPGSKFVHETAGRSTSHGARATSS